MKERDPVDALTDEQRARVEHIARDVAAAYAITPEEATARVLAALSAPVTAPERDPVDARQGGGDDYRLLMLSNARERMQKAEDERDALAARVQKLEAENERLTELAAGAINDGLWKIRKQARRVDEIYEGLRTDASDGTFALWTEDDLVRELHRLGDVLRESA